MKGILNKGIIFAVIIGVLVVFFKVFSAQKEKYNPIKPVSASSVIKTISTLLSEKSPYFDLHKDRVTAKVDSVIDVLESKEYGNENDELLNNIKHIFSELGDRHVSIKKLIPDQDSKRYFLPFALAP